MVVSLEEPGLGGPLVHLGLGHVRDIIDVLDEHIAAPDALIHGGPVIAIHGIRTLEATGDVEQGLRNADVRVGHDTSDEVPEFISGKHRIVTRRSTFLSHI